MGPNRQRDCGATAAPQNRNIGIQQERLHGDTPARSRRVTGFQWGQSWNHDNSWFSVFIIYIWFIPWKVHGFVVLCFVVVVLWHYDDVIMTTIASQITSLTVVYSVVYSGADQRKHQSSASLAFERGIHRDRWIPRTKGQLRGKCFHLMTSSWSHS